MNRVLCLHSLPLITIILGFLTTQFAYSSRSSACPRDQSLALLHFKESLAIHPSASPIFNCWGSDYPKTSSWNTTGNHDCCAWDGIECDELTGNVIGIDLSCSQLNGIIHPNSTLFQLSHLQKLNLAENYLRGSKISNGFASLAGLTHLNLSVSQFSGEISPEIIARMPKLVSLDVSYNSYLKISRTAFKLLLQNMTSIAELSLAAVEIDSVFPSGNLSSSLTYLDLFHTGIYGKLTGDMFRGLPKLTTLLLGNNFRLSGSLQEIGWNDTSSLEVLDLSYTDISGELSDSGLIKSKALRHLDFSHTSISGEISDSFFAHLNGLTYLDLGYCQLTKRLPGSLGNLTRLTYLYLSDNSFTGGFPSSLPNLVDLDVSNNLISGGFPPFATNLTECKYLGLGDNFLSGPIPSIVDGFQKLIQLNLYRNKLSGELPSWLFEHPSLRILDLNSNQLEGQIHEFRYNHIETLDLGGNRFSGPVPESVSQLVNLTMLDLSSNNFSGPVPGWVSRLVNLTTLILSSNNLNGTLDIAVFSNLRQLSHLELSDNNLSLITRKDKVNNTLPASIKNLYCSSCGIEDFSLLANAEALKELDLSKNRIHGHFPDARTEPSTWWQKVSFFNLSYNSLTGFDPQHFPKLYAIDLRSNLLQGPVPIPPPATMYFIVSRNDLTGELPTAMCNISSLNLLDMSHNRLIGRLPRCLENLISHELTVLDLRNNDFHGTIPEIFAKGNSLKTLNLNGNLLQGRIPQSLVNCDYLEVLDIGNNFINGAFPRWLGWLPQLQVLVLKSNEFDGHIAGGDLDANFTFGKLRIMDLSYNGFTGNLPANYFQKFGAMMNDSERKGSAQYMGDYEGYYQDSITVVIKGSEHELVRILTIFTTIDLSNNKFEGEVPSVIGDLRLLRLLNLSYNNLGGRIPPQLGNISELESLDLSSNQLKGTIPQELASLTFLSFLNLSQNHLVGCIPRGTQLDTFSNDSYDGNPGLHGFPLSTRCGDNKSPQFTHSKEEMDSQFGGGFTWRVVLMGYAIGSVLGLLVGYILLTLLNPYWLVRILDAGERIVLNVKRGRRPKISWQKKK